MASKKHFLAALVFALAFGSEPAFSQSLRQEMERQKSAAEQWKAACEFATKNAAYVNIDGRMKTLLYVDAAGGITTINFGNAAKVDGKCYFNEFKLGRSVKEWSPCKNNNNVLAISVISEWVYENPNIVNYSQEIKSDCSWSSKVIGKGIVNRTEYRRR